MDHTRSSNDSGPVFYIGQHESKRTLPVTDATLRQAQDCGYDMLTTPITTPHFHSRVLTLLSTHLSQLRPPSYHPDETQSLTIPEVPPPIIPPLTPVDTPLTPGDSISQLLAVASPWTDLCSPDPLIANISRQVLQLEVAYAAFCGIGNVIIPGPKLHHRGEHGTGLTQYARAVQEALAIGSYLAIQILLPMSDHPDTDMDEGLGSLVPFSREDFVEEAQSHKERRPDSFGTWDAWHVVRSVCKYSPRLFVALSIPHHLPPKVVQNRWFCEPLRLMHMQSTTFTSNKNNHPVLSKAHQSLINRYMRLRIAPWFLLSDVGPIPKQESANAPVPVADGFISPNASADATNGKERSESPTPAEAQAMPEETKKKAKDPTPHLSYLRHLQRTQPRPTTIEKFGSGYQDYLQAPLQPLTDNLESITYEVFEKDPVKYDWYERAIAAALHDWDLETNAGSGPNDRLVVAVAGAGRGPLVNRALRASVAAGIDIELWAVEKNPNAYVLLQRHNENDWGGQVHVIKSDMRAWKGPWRPSTNPFVNGTGHNYALVYGKVDILISELLGSFADNELSPECLDGVQHVLHPGHGISIPSSYTAHLTPVAAPQLHSDISSRTAADPTAPEIPYVVMLHAINYLSTSGASGSASKPIIQEAWGFSHPLDPSVIATSQLRRSGGVSGGGGGQIAGSDGANEHNARFARLRFPCPNRGACDGLAGYFEATLWGDVELSTRPDRMEGKSKDMISWFPIYFPLKKSLYFPDDSELVVSIWRQTDDRKVWYEWMVEAFTAVRDQHVRLGCSEMHSSRKTGCLM
ncbi:MAG: methyltransferase protein [Caeruleum heppii]|nr:MAG: methyltransferase protein [Caeruleum heppii]